MNSLEKSTRSQRILAAVYALLLLFLLLIVNMEGVRAFLNSVFDLLRAIIWGLVFSYMINPFLRIYEKRVLGGIRHIGLRRALALVLSYLTFLLLLGLVAALLLPQLYQSIVGFFTNFEGYMQAAISRFNTLVSNLSARLASIGINQNFLHPLDPESINISLSALLLNVDKILAGIETLFDTDGNSVIGLVGSLFDGITDGVFAFFVSLYLLSTKEKRYAQIMKIRRALFSDRFNASLTHVFSVTDRTFGGFLRGKLIEATVIFLAAYLLFLPFGIPYPLLLAVIGGLCNFIPFVGPIIGLIPCMTVVLLADSSKLLSLILIVLVIQQVEKNLISPKLLYNSFAVSSLCVLIAITTVGSIFGFWGLIIAVPLFATVIELVSADIDARLRKKGISSNTENHYPSDSMVDPVKDMQTTPDTIIKSLERRIVRLQNKKERGLPLSRGHRFWMWLYDFCLRHHIFTELSNESLLQFRVDETAQAAEEEAEELIRRMQGVDLLDK